MHFQKRTLVGNVRERCIFMVQEFVQNSSFFSSNLSNENAIKEANFQFKMQNIQYSLDIVSNTCWTK